MATFSIRIPSQKLWMWIVAVDTLYLNFCVLPIIRLWRPYVTCTIYIYIYIYIYIRHRAARHARACSRQCQFWAVWCLVFLFFKGPTASWTLFLVWLASLFFHICSVIFSELIFLQWLVPKGRKMGASKQPQITQISKNSSSKRTHDQDLLKDSAWKGPNL